MSDLKQVIATSSPHIKTEDDTRAIMLDVIIALLPAFAISIFTFGARAASIVAVSVITAVLCEWLYRRLMKKPQTVGDLSAVVTGMLLAYNVPVTIPLWVPMIGSAFAIIVVKQLYGGIGKNFMNPALAARAFLFSWPVLMTTWVMPRTALPLFATPVDVVSAATPLATLKGGALPDGVSLLQCLLGQTGGCLGETSALCLLAGGLYLVYRRVISVRIPLAYLGTVAVLCLLFPMGNDPFLWTGYQLLSGGLMLGAIFMATDYATSPVTAKGQILFGVGCGLITVFIRYFGSYAEGVSYSILIMNATVWLIDKYLRPRKFGYQKPKKEKKPAKAAEGGAA